MVSASQRRREEPDDDHDHDDRCADELRGAMHPLAELTQRLDDELAQAGNGAAIDYGTHEQRVADALVEVERGLHAQVLSRLDIDVPVIRVWGDEYRGSAGARATTHARGDGACDGRCTGRPGATATRSIRRACAQASPPTAGCRTRRARWHTCSRKGRRSKRRRPGASWRGYRTRGRASSAPVTRSGGCTGGRRRGSRKC